MQHRFLHIGTNQQIAAGDSLDTADAGSNRGLADDLEAADLSGVLDVGAAAELGGPALNINNTDDLAVLLAEQSHSAQLLGLFDGHFLDGDVHRLEDLVVDDLLHAEQLLGSDSAEVGEVEVGDGSILIGACLMDVVAQDLAQSCLQQVGSGVVAGDGHAVFLIHAGGQMVADMDDAALEGAGVDVVALGGLLDVLHTQHALSAGDDAVVCGLTAHLSVERGLIENDQHTFLGLLVGGDGVGQSLLVAQRHNDAVALEGVVADELGGLSGQSAEQVFAPAGDVLLEALSTGALLLLGHLGVEALLVDLDALLRGDLLGQVEGEAEGIVQLEDVQTLQQVLVSLFQTVDHVVQDVHAGVDGAGKVCLLGADDLLDIGVVLTQLGVSGLAGLDDRLHQLHEEGAADAQHTAMAGSAAEQTAQHVAAAFVGGQDAVRHHEGAAADVVGDDADGDVLLGVGTVGLAGDVLHMVQHALDGIDLEQVAHALHHAGQTLQTHAGINVGACQTLVMALAVGVELAEHQVPDLHIAVAVTAHAAGRLAAAILGAAVEVDLRAGAARTGAVLPEVVFLAQTDHVVGGNAHLLGPDVVSLIVLFVDGDVQLILRDSHPLVGSQELPCPGNDLFLEVILEGEVAQHLEEGAVAGGDAHALDVRGADALLAGGHAMTGRLLLSEEPLLHRCHAAVDEQQAGVVLRDEREAVQTQVALALKEGKVLVTQFIQTGPLHSFNLSSCIGVLLRTQFLWQSGKKQKTALIPKRDEGCLKSSVVPPKLQKCRRGAPAALCAVTLRSVRFVSPEAPGWRKKCSAGTPFSQGRSLWAAAHILLAPSLPFAIITIHAQRACCSFAFISDYSIVRPFVNGFSQKSRFT